MPLTFTASPQLPRVASPGTRWCGGLALAPAGGSDAYGARPSVRGLPPGVAPTFFGLNAGGTVEDTRSGLGLLLEVGPSVPPSTYRLVLHLDHRSGSYDLVFPLQVCKAPAPPAPVFPDATDAPAADAFKALCYRHRNLLDTDGSQSGAWNYDGAYGAFLAGAYFEDPAGWFGRADAVIEVYLQKCLALDAAHTIPGYEVWARDLWSRARLAGDGKARQALDNLARYSEFLEPNPAAAALTCPDNLRELSLALEVLVAQADLGADDPRRPLYLEYVLSCLDQLYVGQTWAKRKPFMAALAVRALSWYYERWPDPRIPRLAVWVADWLACHAWCPDTRQLWYSDFDEPEQGSRAFGKEDMALGTLHAYCFARAFAWSGDPLHRDLADACFASAVAADAEYSGKEFSQLLLCAFDCLSLRQPPPLSFADRKARLRAKAAGVVAGLDALTE